MGLFSGIIGSIIGGASSAASTRSTNEANKDIAENANEFNAEQADINRQFNASQAEMGRDFASSMQEDAQRFNSAEAWANRDWQNQQRTSSEWFNANEAQKNRDYQTEMSNTQYQRAVGDMRAAGINPMLAYSQGGAGTPSGSTASISAGGGAQGSSGTASAGNASAGGMASANLARLTEVLGPAINTGMRAAELNQGLDNQQAQKGLIDAQTARTLNGINSDTASAYAARAQGDKIIAEIPNVLAQLDGIKADVRMKNYDWESGQFSDLKQAEINLKSAQTEYIHGQGSLLEVDKQLRKLQVSMAGYAVPGARNEANSQNTWWKQNVTPYLPDFLKGASGAASVMKMIP